MYLTVKEKATSSVKWSALGQWIKRIVQFVILILLARSLTPREYGIIEFSTLVLTLGQILQDFGLGRALVQTQTNLPTAANLVFWVNLALSIAAYCLIAALASPLAMLFGEQEIITVLYVTGLQLLVLALRSVHIALAQRGFMFRSLFLTEVGSSLAMIIFIGIFLASGYRVWAYIYGVLIGSIVQTLILIVLIPWRPAFNLSLFNPESRGLLRFGGFAALESFQGWLLNYGDNLIVGYFLGLEALGVYALAFNISVLSFSLVLQPLTSIAYSAFSSLQTDTAEVRRAFLNILQISSMILIPMGAGIALIADPISNTVLAGRWVGIASIIQLLAIFPGSISHLLFINPELYRSLGRPDVMPKLLIIALAYSIPAYLLGVHHGLIGFTLARVSVTLVFFPVQVFLVSRFLKLDIVEYLRALASPFLFTLGMVLVAHYFILRMTMNGSWAQWVQLGVTIGCSAGLYFFLYYLLDRQSLSRALVLVKQLM